MTRWLQKSRVLALGLALVAGLAAWGLWPRPAQVTVEGLDRPVSFQTTKKTLALALQAQGIALDPADQVSVPLTTALKGSTATTIKIERAVPVTIAVDGRVLELKSAAKTVGQLLQEAALSLGQHDRLSLATDTAVTAGISLRIVRRQEQVVTRDVDVPFDTVKREDRTLAVGTSREVQAGSAGLKRVTTKTVTEDGQELESTVVEEVVVQTPVDRVVAFGTAGVVSRGGRDYRFQKEFTMTATGYTAGKESNPNGNGYTYTGMKAVRGVVAVDPRVIPLYSRVYVEGYGPAIAADIGGAIKGNRIDLCFETVPEALNWGVRPVTVYLLNE